MPFESQNSKIKAFYVALKPAGFSLSALVYGAGLCFVTCTEGGEFLMSREVSWCCISAPLHLKWVHLAHREMHFPGFFWNQRSFSSVVFLFAVKICCAGSAFPASAFSGVCEERRKKDFINFPTQTLCSCPFPTSFDTSTRDEAYPQLELSWLSWWVPALAPTKSKHNSCVLPPLSQEAHYSSLCLFSWNMWEFKDL